MPSIADLLKDKKNQKRIKKIQEQQLIEKEEEPLIIASPYLYRSPIEKNQPETTTVDNSRQTTTQPETNRRQQKTTTVDNVEQVRKQPETTTHQPETTTVDNSRQIITNKNDITKTIKIEAGTIKTVQPTVDNSRQNMPVSGLNNARLPLDSPLSTVDFEMSPVLSPVINEKDSKKDGLSPVVSGKKDSRLLLQPDTETVDNSRQQAKLPTSTQQLIILQFLVDEQVRLGFDHTSRYKIIDLSKSIGVPPKGLKKQISRLIDSSYLLRLNSKDGRGDAGTVYKVPLAVVSNVQNHYNRRQQPETTVDNNRRQQLETFPGSSSRLINTTSTTNQDDVENPDQDHADRFTALVQRLRLDEKGIGANDLLSVWRRVLQRKGLFKKFEDLEQSLEHLAFYLDTKDAGGLKNPKAWLLKEIERGYYPAPAGFVSLEERQEEAKLADLKKRLERLRGIQSQKFEAEFEIWLSDLSEDRKKALAGTMSPGSRVALAVLRSAFAEEKGIELPQEHTKAGG